MEDTWEDGGGESALTLPLFFRFFFLDFGSDSGAAVVVVVVVGS